MLLAALGLAAPAAAQPPAASPAEPSGRTRLSGDWGGARGELRAWGVEVFARYTAGVWANLHGGFETGARYEGFAEWALELALDRLLGWPGARLHVGWHSYHGGQPSRDLVGLFSNDPLSRNEAADSTRFYGIYLEQQLFAGALRIRLGQIAVDDELPDSSAIDTFLDAGAASFGIGGAEFASPFYPVAAPGVFVDARPGRGWRLSGGVYSADPGPDERSNWGFDWSLDEGASFAARIARQVRPTGRPGRLTLGLLATTRKLPDFGDGGRARGAYAFFGRLEQALWTRPDGAPRIAAYVRGGYAPQGDRAVVRGYLDAGLVWYGPLPGRPDDRLGVGFGYTDFGSDYLAATRAGGDDVSGSESALELTARIQLRGWLTLQPDLQIRLDPHRSRRDAVAIGLQAVITL